VNKPISDEDIQRTMETAFDMNFNVKLYFLIGLPTETHEDMEDLLNLIRDLEVMAPHPNSVRISINPFIPKPHTPFSGLISTLKI
jgi:radical SAM superfamily enzyme YgiQ (UPF0313 family)